MRLSSSIAILAVVFATFGCAVAPAVLSSPAPRVTVTPERHDLGVVALGEDAVAEMVVRNVGSAPLTLAAPTLPRATRVEGLVPELSPGASIPIRFRIDTLNAKAERQQDWTLETNDPDRPRVTIPVRLEVRPFLGVQPGQARYITVQHAREGTISQTIGALDGAAFRVLRVDSPLPFLRIAFREAAETERRPAFHGSQWRVSATLPPDAPVGALSGMIVVHTDHPRQKRAFVSVSGFVRPMLAATPPEARLGDLDRRRTRPLQMLIKNFAEEPIDVTGVSTDVSAVGAQIEPLERGRVWRLKLLPAREAPLGAFTGKVVVRTASPKVPTFEIPLSGRLVESVRPE